MTSLEALAAALRARGDEAVVVTPEMPGFRDDSHDVVRIPSLPLPTRSAYRLALPYVPKDLGTLSIVHTHSPFVTGWLGALTARRARIPLVFTYHTQLEEYAHYVPFEAHATRSAAMQLTRTYANGTDAVIVPTASMERHLRGLGVQTRIDVVPSGIDVAAFAAGKRSDDVRARLGARPREALVLCVGRLGREKNVELAIEAFARLDAPAARLAIIGEGTHKDMLERCAARMGVAGRTTFAREFAHDELPDAYASCDAFVFTSRSETQGLVLVEALAAGAPVVALDTPQTRDVLAGAGRLVSGDARALAEALRETLAGRIANRALGARVARNYDGSAVGERVVDVYRSLLGSARELAAAR